MSDIHISIVSHSQQVIVADLLVDIESLDSSSRCQVTITFNIPEHTSVPLPNVSFPVNLIHNSSPKGFSANHNHAFRSALSPDERRYFIVVNPDVRFREDVITKLVNTLDENKNIGLAAPVTVGVDGTLEDSIRELPTPTRIIAKLFGRRGHWKNVKSIQPDWVAGMFMAFHTNVFQKIGGFDEKYFLYYEDVDICSRLWLEGYCIKIEKTASIIHDAQRRSWRNIKYLRWHISSMVKFFSSDIYRKIKIHHEQRIK